MLASFPFPTCPLLTPTHTQIFRADINAFMKSSPAQFQTYLTGRMNHTDLGIAFFFLNKTFIEIYFTYDKFHSFKE